MGVGTERDNGFFLRYRSRNPSIDLARSHQTAPDPAEIILFLNYWYILVRNLVKQLGNALPVVAAPDNLCKHDPNVNHVQFPTPRDIFPLWKRVCDDKFGQGAFLNRFQRPATEDAVSHDRIHTFRAGIRQLLGSEHEGAAGVGHVVDEDRNLVLDVADEDHPGDLVCLLPLLVEQGEIDAEPIGHRGRSVWET